MLRDIGGKDLTLKGEYQTGSIVSIVYILYIQVFYSWRKVTHKFLKRMDPCLRFYYYISRFYEGIMPTFDTKPCTRPQKKRIPRYELLVTNDRATMAVCGKLQWEEPDGAIHVFDGLARECELLDHPLPAVAKIMFSYENAFICIVNALCA